MGNESLILNHKRTITNLTVNIKIREEAAILYQIVKNMDQFPNYMAGVHSLRISNINYDEFIICWGVSIENKILEWREKIKFDESRKEIIFKMVAGDFKDLYGFWKIEKTGDTSRLTFSITIDWDSEHFKNYDISYLERKAKYAIIYMLKKIRTIVGSSNVIKIKNERQLAVISEKFSYKNRHGKSIVGYYDYLKDHKHDFPVIVIAPSYGETKRESLLLSYYLAKNGFDVFRYDGSNHIGESEGNILDFTLNNAKEDLQDTLTFLENRFNKKNFGVIAKSLSKRTTIKAAIEDNRIKFIFSIVGIVDLRSTLAKVHQEDIMGRIARGEEEKRETIETFGFEVKMDFARTAITDNYFDLATTKEDLKHVRIPMVFLVSEKDVWNNLDDARHLFDFSKNIIELIVLPETMHQIYENPIAARNAIRLAVSSATKYLRKKIILDAAINEPMKREIVWQSKIEKASLKKTLSFTKKDEQDFWNWYLSNYSIIGDSREFKNLLGKIYYLLEIKNSDILLDAGCGVGLFGKWILDNKPNIEISYIGLDFSEKIVERARRKHDAIPGKRNINRKYLINNLENQIELPKNFVTKICCNLVISYVAMPSKTINLLYDVLKPGGKIAISSLKPYSDLSNIYLKFVSYIHSEEKAIEAKNLFNEAGKILYKEKIGHYNFYEEAELSKLLKNSRFKHVSTLKMFDNQIILAIGEK